MIRYAVALSILAPFLMAQVDTGIIGGTVRDSTGSVLPDAAVTVLNEGTGQQFEFKGDEGGRYVSPPLRPGVYVVEASAQGFEKMAQRLRLDVNQRAEINFELKVGAVAQSVEVREVVPVLQTETSTLSNLRTEKAIKDLPLNGRNFAQLIGLAPGAMPAQTQTTGSPITMKRGITGYAVNGARLEDNNFLLDGINNNENHNGLGILIFPPIEAVEQFRLEASVADAQFGRGTGGTINLSFKSGTKDYHGGLFEFLRNSAMDAKNFFERSDAKIIPFKMNQFGAFFGGRLFPWQRDPTTFFFADYEGHRLRQAQALISSVPVPAFLNGDFSSAPQRIYDPLTQRANPAGGFLRDPFPGNVIPGARIDPVGRNILGLFPQPNLGAGQANNYFFDPVRSNTVNSVDIKVDHNFSASDTMFVRYSRAKSDLSEPSFLPVPAVGNGPGVPGLNSQPVNQVVLSETHLFSPAAVNQARIGWTRLNLRAFNPNFGKYLSSEIGVPGGNVPGDILTSGLTIFSVTGLRDLGDNGFSPAVIVSDNIQINDNVNVIRGSHTIKFGGEFQRRRYNAFQSNVLRGTMAFTTAYTVNPAAAAGTGIGAADALLGRPINGSIRYLEGTRGFRRSEYALFAQDDVRVNSRLTLNLGLRYEVYSGWPWTEVNNRMSQFVAESHDVVRVGAAGVPRSAVNGDFNNFGPRIGLALRLTSRTVFRGGYGVFYAGPQLDITRNLAANPPDFIVSAFSNNQFDFPGARPASAGFLRPDSGTVAGATLNALDPNARTSYMQQWNATLQNELPGAVGLTLAYVGTKGTKLLARPNINQPVPGLTPIAQRRPFPRFDNIQATENRYSSSYHGLQITAEKRYAKGLTFLASYTWSHSLDEASAHYVQPMDLRNIRLDRGNSDFDAPHRLAVSFGYELPFKASGPARHVVQGWQLNGIWSAFSGLPFSVQSAANTLNIGSGTRADRLRDGALPEDERTLQRWFDVAAFATPGPQQFGNGGRNILRGPGTNQFDFSVFKHFPLGRDEARRLQFRAEFFNLTNTPQFNNTNSTVGAAGAGSITSAGAPLNLQRTSRQIQLALKFYF